ncbi:hypothetical protein [Bartonella sp. AU55XJBT]|uniref:hypothetical protein n=1 Tax=Bartonella sp. AU55XJBT TaxID=3019091 RepID=UPI0023609AC6|nr:hypothetical protein [Bartonella sp. AU55XJBT]
MWFCENEVKVLGVVHALGRGELLSWDGEDWRTKRKPFVNGRNTSWGEERVYWCVDGRGEGEAERGRGEWDGGGVVAIREGRESEGGEVGFYDHKVWSIILQRTVVKWRKL